jgi:hypothetical protein
MHTQQVHSVAWLGSAFAGKEKAIYLRQAHHAVKSMDGFHYFDVPLYKADIGFISG